MCTWGWTVSREPRLMEGRRSYGMGCSLGEYCDRNGCEMTTAVTAFDSEFGMLREALMRRSVHRNWPIRVSSITMVCSGSASTPITMNQGITM